MSKAIILASGSKNRQQGLSIAQIPYISVPADIDEKAIQHEDIRQRIILVARAKVEVVKAERSGLILGADGVIMVDKQVMEKPVDKAEAKAMLLKQSEASGIFLTGYYLTNTESGNSYQGIIESIYTFRKLSEDEIDEYIGREPVLNWAAAFSPANSTAIRFVETVEGSYSNFNYSVPIATLMPILRAEGYLNY